MLLFGLGGGYTFWAGATQGLVSGIVRHCASTGSACVYGIAFVHVGAFRRRDRHGFRFGSGGHSRKAASKGGPARRTHTQYTALVSRGDRNRGGWVKGSDSAACKYQDAIFLLFFKPLVPACSGPRQMLCVFCMCAPEHVAGHKLCAMEQLMQYVLEGGEAALRFCCARTAGRYLDPATWCWSGDRERHLPRRSCRAVIDALARAPFEPHVFSLRVVPCRSRRHHHRADGYTFG